MRRFSTAALFFIIAGGTAGCASRPAEPAAAAVPAPVPGSGRPVANPITPPMDFARAVERGTRTSTGAPGPRYWQQWTDYVLTARLDPAAKRLDGTARITYHNNSPDTLPFLALHLYQNVFAPGAVRNRPAEVTGGVVLDSVVVGGTVIRAYPEPPSRPPQEPGYLVQGTNLLIRPPATVAAGATVELEIAWHFTVPADGTGRMGWNREDLFHIAYWYPQMAVYDDVVGWQADQFLGNAEFYHGFGSYDLTVDVPEGWLVMATGRFTNAEEVLAEPVLERLRRAEQSDSVVHVVTPEDLAGSPTRMGEGGRLRWRFVSDTVRDAAFSVTRRSRWDAARTPVGDRDGDGRPDYARVDAFWRDLAPRWARMWRYAQHSIDFLSRWTGLSYPWPHMSVVEGSGIIGGGMEYPMMTLIGDYSQAGDTALYNVTAHELAHMWVPMQVGTDETRYGWMDEGTTTFNENQAREEFFPGLDHDLPDQDQYVALARRQLEGEMMRWTDYHYPGRYILASYQKPASALNALRGVLGDSTFVAAYREYLARWRWKHPKPWDFFNAVEDVAGRDLDWFWRTWYYETWTLDQAVGGVSQSEREAVIRIEDRGEAPMPVHLRITTAAGDTLRRELPVDPWLRGLREATVTVPGQVVKVEIDPERWFPDVNRENNVWSR